MFIKKKLLQELTPLKDGIFESGAYGVPSKSQNPTVLGLSGPSSTQCSNPGHDICAIHLAPTTKAKSNYCGSAENPAHQKFCIHFFIDNSNVNFILYNLSCPKLKSGQLEV